MKAVIPVAGAGTRLRPLTYTQPKPLIPVAGKPIISFIIDQLIEQGIRDFIFVIGYLGEKIKNYVDNAYPDINREYITQEVRLGSGHAIWTARDIIRSDNELVVFFGDVILDVDFKKVIQCPNSCLCVKKVEDPAPIWHSGIQSGRARKTGSGKTQNPKVGYGYGWLL